MWPDRRLLDLFGIKLPIVQAPMAAATGVEMAVAVAKPGGLGSLPCAMLAPDTVTRHLRATWSASSPGSSGSIAG